MQHQNLLIERVRYATTVQQTKVFSPAPLTLIEATEAKLGFRLPDLLRQLYLEVGNGGFGPQGQNRLHQSSCLIPITSPGVMRSFGIAHRWQPGLKPG